MQWQVCAVLKAKQQSRHGTLQAACSKAGAPTRSARSRLDLFSSASFSSGSGWMTEMNHPLSVRSALTCPVLLRCCTNSVSVYHLVEFMWMWCLHKQRAVVSTQCCEHGAGRCVQPYRVKSQDTIQAVIASLAHTISIMHQYNLALQDMHGAALSSCGHIWAGTPFCPPSG